MLRTFLAVACLCLAAAVMAAPEADPPPGVTLEVVDREVPQAAREEAPALPERPAEQAQMDISYQGVPFAQVLDDLEDRLQVIIICDDTRLLRRNYHRQMRVPESAALMAVCGSVLQLPRPTHILCAPDEVMDGHLRPEVTADAVINLKLEDAELGPALDWIRRETGVTVHATGAVAEVKVTFSADEITVSDALEQIAEASGAELTTGFVLEPIQIDRELERLERMSNEDLERMFSRGLDALDRARADDVGGLGANPQGTMQAGLQDGMRMFNDLDPQERRELIQAGASAIQRFGRITQRLTPQTRSRLQQFAAPLAGLAVAGYVALPPRTRAEVAPLMQALQTFGW